jgi:hypothetical protein
VLADSLVALATLHRTMVMICRCLSGALTVARMTFVGVI